MSKRLEKLMFTIGLIDKTKGPANRVLKTIDKINQRTQQGIRQSAVGAVGLVGSAYALQSALRPAIEMDRALGEVSSLFDTNKNLQGLRDTAIDFSTKYGESATDFVKASYDIQSAISGLKGNDLAKFTESSAILAKATKADSATITDYMGTMYGIFKEDAAKLGNANWVQQVAGQTATAVQMFKTTGSKMAGAFGNLGAEATSHGIAMSEQIAILGTLQATMSGTESGTKYRAFLDGVSKAQDKLGLSFTDSAGKMLSMPVILQRIKNKVGDIDTVAAGKALKDAFGSSQAVGLIKLLMKDMTGLQGSMSKLAKTKGMDKAIAMAEKQVDPWERFSQMINNVSIAFGSALLPILKPIVNWLVEGGQQVIEWTRMFPNLTTVVGGTVTVILGLVGVMAAFALVVGISKIVVVGFGVVLGTLKGVLLSFQGALLLAKGAMWLLNASLYANPVAWLIKIILIAAVVIGVAIWAIVAHWDTLKEKGAAAVQWVIDKFKKIPEFFSGLKKWFKDFDLFEFLDVGLLDKIKGIFGSAEKEKAQLKAAAPSLNNELAAQVTEGGITNQLSKAVSNSKSIGDVHIHTTEKVDGNMIYDELEAIPT